MSDAVFWDTFVPIGLVVSVLVMAAGVTGMSILLTKTILDMNQERRRKATAPMLPLRKLLGRPPNNKPKPAIVHDDQALWKREQDEK